MEYFVVKHYSSDERPTVKGHGFDGLEVGEERWEAEEFADFLNGLLDLLQGWGCSYGWKDEIYIDSLNEFFESAVKNMRQPPKKCDSTTS